jgi:hypothetical protein
MRSDHSTNNMIGLKRFLFVKIQKGSIVEQGTKTYVKTADDL